MLAQIAQPEGTTSSHSGVLGREVRVYRPALIWSLKKQRLFRFRNSGFPVFGKFILD